MLHIDNHINIMLFLLSISIINNHLDKYFRASHFLFLLFDRDKWVIDTAGMS